MAGKECWSVGKGRGAKSSPDFGGGGISTEEEEEETHPGSPPTQEPRPICLKVSRFHTLQAALTKPL